MSHGPRDVQSLRCVPLMLVLQQLLLFGCQGSALSQRSLQLVPLSLERFDASATPFGCAGCGLFFALRRGSRVGRRVGHVVIVLIGIVCWGWNVDCSLLLRPAASVGRSRCVLEDNRNVCFARDAASPGLVGQGFAQLAVDEVWNVIAGRVNNRARLVFLVALSGPSRALPAAEILDLLVSQIESVESGEESCVVLVAAETHAVRAIAVVKTRVLGFYGRKLAIEDLDFHANFLNEVLGQMSGERRRVVHGRVRVKIGV